MALGDNVISIIIRAKDEVSKGLSRVKKRLGDFRGAAIAVAGVGAVVAKGMWSATSSAIEFQETLSKFNVIFDEVEKDAHSIAKTIAKDFDMSKQQIYGMLSATGDLLTGFGYADEEALQMSESIATLSGDIASFSNIQGGAERVNRIVTKSLTGETEGLKELGVVVNQSMIQDRLKAKGLGELVGLEKERAEALATFELIQEQSTNAIGDYARTSDSAANSIRAFKSTISDLFLELGQKLLPVVQDKIIPAISSLLEWVKGASPVTKQLALVLGLVTVAVAILTTAVLALTVVSLPWLLIIGAIIAAITGVIMVIMNWAKIVSWFKEIWTKAMIEITMAWELYKDNFIIAVEIMKNAFLRMWNFIIQGYETNINYIIKGINRMIKVINRLPGVDIPLVPKVDLSGIKAQLTDVGALKTELGEERLGMKERLYKEAGITNNINVEISGVVGDADAVVETISEGLQDSLSTKIRS